MGSPPDANWSPVLCFTACYGFSWGHNCHHIISESWDKMEAARWVSTQPDVCSIDVSFS